MNLWRSRVAGQKLSQHCEKVWYFASYEKVLAIYGITASGPDEDPNLSWNLRAVP